MALFCFSFSVLTFTVILQFFFISGAISSPTFTILNKCEHTVWPGISSNAGIAQLPTTGFALQKGQSKAVAVPPSWGGRFWGRTLCTEDDAGRFSCVTGDCDSGRVECSGSNAAPPATLAEFTLDGSGGLDFYDVSLVDGYNIPMLVVPQGGTGQNCTNTGCVEDLIGACPAELKVVEGGNGVACRSACDVFGKPEYCCSGAYGSPDTCKPSAYSVLFKNACPHAYSYAYDDRTSTFTCAGAGDYVITFCPSPNTSKKSSSEGPNPATSNPPPSMDNTMIYEGGALEDASGGTPSSSPPSIYVIVAVAVASMATTWRLSHLL